MGHKIGSYQIWVEPDDEHKNAVTAGQLGAWRIKVMLQGDCNASATVMRVMNSILSPYSGEFVWVYLDDILIFSDTREQYIEHLRKVFTKLQGHSSYLRMGEPMPDEIETVGHTIRGNTTTPAAEKTRHIADS